VYEGRKAAACAKGTALRLETFLACELKTWGKRRAGAQNYDTYDWTN